MMARGGLLQFIFIIMSLIALFALFAPVQFEKTKNNVLSNFGFASKQEPVVNNPTPSVPINNVPITPVADPPRAYALEQTVTIANWNLEIFGMTKADNLDLLRKYANIIDDYDIIFVQEIRDINELAFDRLCAFLPDYNCQDSSRAGRSTSKEQYGIISKKEIIVVEVKDYNPDSLNRWERPPIAVTFDHNGYEFTVFNIHTKPDDVQMELYYLETVVDQFPEAGTNTIIIGDLNADCSYYSELYDSEFDDWHWLVKDYERTNMGQIPCAYDRIILNDESFGEYLNYGIRTSGIDATLSDHYLVWVEMNSSVN